jgi:hypothetical protein
VDYSAEVQQVLADLDNSLGEVSSSKRRLLTVRGWKMFVVVALVALFLLPLWPMLFIWMVCERGRLLPLVTAQHGLNSSTLPAVAAATHLAPKRQHTGSGLMCRPHTGCTPPATFTMHPAFQQENTVPVVPALSCCAAAQPLTGTVSCL